MLQSPSFYIFIIEQYQEFIKEQIASTGKGMLITGILLPIVSAGFWIWFLTSGQSVVLPRWLAAVFAFGFIIGPFMIFSYLRTRNPEKSGLYKMLFIDNNPKTLKIQKITGSFNFSFTAQGSVMPKTITIRSKENAEKLMGFVQQYHPNVVVTK